jgi:hypothetical protein
MLLPQAVDKADAIDLQQRNKSDEQSDVMSNSKVTASSIVDSQSALQNSIETGAVSLEPVRTEQDKTHGDSMMGGSSASDGKKVVEEGKGKMEEDSERGTTGSETNKRKAQVDTGVIHKKKKSSLSGKIFLHLKLYTMNVCVLNKSRNLIVKYVNPLASNVRYLSCTEMLKTAVNSLRSWDLMVFHMQLIFMCLVGTGLFQCPPGI